MKSTQYVEEPVFISDKFIYYGDNRINIPAKYLCLVGGRGTRVNHNEKVQNSFIEWLKSNCELGLHGMPKDNPDKNGHKKTFHLASLRSAGLA
ncbi:hypothetical protein [Desulfosediminicola ganghwensis]|uniref:Nmad2 family putative nucleotide modification protein n=1 Tax=Desulfosediminicola ganghwensis TaxID=2569540 RepID=UPI00142F1EDF